MSGRRDSLIQLSCVCNGLLATSRAESLPALPSFHIPPLSSDLLQTLHPWSVMSPTDLLPPQKRQTAGSSLAQNLAALHPSLPET